MATQAVDHDKISPHRQSAAASASSARERIQARSEGGDSELSDKLTDTTNVAQEIPHDDDEPPKSDLPFSKARCIALVATVTGASFLNVRVFPSLTMDRLDN